MENSTKESLTKELDRLSRFYFENRLYELFDRLDDVMQNYFSMRKVRERNSREGILIKRNIVLKNEGMFKYGIIPTEEPYGIVPICNCKTYERKNSGLVFIVIAGETPRAIIPSFNRLYWMWYFYGDFWKKERPMKIEDTSMSCAFRSLPKSVEEVYYPERSLSYIIENFGRAERNRKKKKVFKVRGFLEKALRI